MSAADVAKILEVCGVDRVIALDFHSLQIPVRRLQVYYYIITLFIILTIYLGIL